MYHTDLTSFLDYFQSEVGRTYDYGGPIVYQNFGLKIRAIYHLIVLLVRNFRMSLLGKVNPLCLMRSPLDVSLGLRQLMAPRELGPASGLTPSPLQG
jgi:hypothetical protein